MVGFSVHRLRGGGPALGFYAEAVIGPAGDEPLHVGGDGVDKLYVFLDGVGVVEAQVAATPCSRAMPKFRQIDLAWPMWR